MRWREGCSKVLRLDIRVVVGREGCFTFYRILLNLGVGVLGTVEGLFVLCVYIF